MAWYDTSSQSSGGRTPQEWIGENRKWLEGLVVVLLLSALVYLILSTGVLASTFGTPSYKVKSICEIVIDRTGSTSSEATSRHFERLASASVDACAADGALVDIWTTGSDGVNPTLVSKNPIRLIYSGATLRKYAVEQAIAIQSAKVDLSRVFSSPSGNSSAGSDIAAALSQASSTGAKQSANNGGVSEKIIVITDGMQLAQGTAVTSMSTIDSDPEVLARQTQSLYQTSGLRGSNIFFYGVRGGTLDSTGQPLPAWFENKVQGYWSDLVALSGGKICSYQNDQDASSILACGGN